MISRQLCNQNRLIFTRTKNLLAGNNQHALGIAIRGFSIDQASAHGTLKELMSHTIKAGNMDLGLCRVKMGHLSESSVLAVAGGSVVHTSMNSARTEDPKEDFLPLTVDYRSRHYAFGKIPDNRMRKEKHGSDEEVLVSRFIDRAIRPLFPKGYVNELQVIATAHSVDGVHDPTVLAVNAASFALLSSKQPWNGPVGCVRVGIVDNKLKVNPTVEEMEASPLDLLYAGTSSRAVM
jgi:polyribonucleotide nucleotidyltransferase